MKKLICSVLFFMGTTLTNDTKAPLRDYTFARYAGYFIPQLIQTGYAIKLAKSLSARLPIVQNACNESYNSYYKLGRDEKKVLIGNANVPLITNYDLNDVVLGGAMTAVEVISHILQGRKVSLSQVAPDVARVVTKRFVENKIIDGAQVVSTRYHIVDQKSFYGELATGAGHFAAQQLAHVMVNFVESRFSGKPRAQK